MPHTRHPKHAALNDIARDKLCGVLDKLSPLCAITS